MNAPDLVFSFLEHEQTPFRNTGYGDDGLGLQRTGLGSVFLVLCVILSSVFHVGALFLLEFNPMGMDRPSAVLTVDLLEPAPPKALPKPPAEPPEVKTVTAPAEPVKTAAAAPRPEPKPESSPVRAKPAAPAKTPPKKAVQSRKTSAAENEVQRPAVKAPAPEPAARAPIGRLEERPGVTVLANESGEDTLKHGAESRFMHGVATEEFVEDNYVGEYRMSDSSRVWIEDDRARSGHLILHADAMGFHRKLFRFNRFIYVYGQSPEEPLPVLGSVTFFSDGYHIHQFLWQHNSTEAFYPRRN
jgi:hypothetical protein